ncbi:MAG: hypothetical protein Q9163_004796 [Psora crenata]
METARGNPQKVSGIIIAGKGLHFDAEQERLYRDGVTIADAKMINGRYILEDNTAFNSKTGSTYAATIKRATPQDWQHTGNYAIPDLDQAAKGVVTVADKENIPHTNECEICALFRAHAIVSRSSTKSETSNEPSLYDTLDIPPTYTSHTIRRLESDGKEVEHQEYRGSCRVKE